MTDKLFAGNMTPGEWINARHGAMVPDNDRRVLCLTMTKKGILNHVIGYYDHVRWCCGMNSNVIAWMELPEPPAWAKAGRDVAERK